jgi:lipopolysaccharide export system protein LptA
MGRFRELPSRPRESLFLPLAVSKYAEIRLNIRGLRRFFSILFPFVLAKLPSLASATLVIAFFIVSGARAQQTSSDDGVQQNQPLFLQAEKLVGNQTEAGLVRELSGNVVLTQGNVTVTCRRAVHYVERNRADLFGNVVMTQGAVTMKAAEAIYDGAARQIFGSGGVSLVDCNSVLTARSGIYSITQKIARFFRQVRIDNDSLLIYCDTLEHRRINQESYATGNVVAVSKKSSVVLHGDSLAHFPAERYTRLARRPLSPQPMVSQIDTVFTDGGAPDSIASNARQMSAKKADNRAFGDNRRFRLDTLCIAGDVLEAFRSDGELYRATGEVQTTRRNFAGRSARADYEKILHRIRLLPYIVISEQTAATLHSSAATIVYSSTTANIRSRRVDVAKDANVSSLGASSEVSSEDSAKRISDDANASFGASSNARGVSSSRPRVWLDSTQLRSADSIIAFIKDKRLERLQAFGGAFAATKNDTARQDRIDQLAGEAISITLERDTVQSIVAEEKAFNVYFVLSEAENAAQEPDGAVRNAADTIKILFSGGKVETIIWRGKVEGEYTPEHIAQKQLDALKLPGFEWMEDKPVLQRKPVPAESRFPRQTAKTDGRAQDSKRERKRELKSD